MNDWLIALRSGVRALRRDKASSGVSVLALAVGICAASTVFSVVDGVLLRPLPFRDLERLVAIWKADPAQPDAWRFPAIANLLDWKAEATSFEILAAGRNRSYTLTSFEDGGTPLMQEVSCDYFDLLGVAPQVGREFDDDDCRPGAPPVIVLSDDLWRRLFGADPGVLGRTTELDGRPYQIVGILPRGFDNPVFGIDVRSQAFLPMRLPASAAGMDRGVSEGVVLGRLKPGVSLEAARGDMQRVDQSLRLQYPDAYERAIGVVVPMAERLTRAARTPVLLLFGAVLFVLLVALANVASIALTRALERQREIAVRRALGAGTLALMRQFVGETLVLAVASGALGLALVPASIRGLDLLMPTSPQFPRFRFEVDVAVVLFAAGLSVLAAILVGLAPLAPALHGSLEQHLGVAATRATGDPLRRRLRAGLVTAEVALSLVLLVGSGLTLRSLAGLYGLDPGFDPDRTLTFRVSTRGPNYQGDAAREAFFRAALDGFRAIPGVEAAGSATIQPFLTQFGSVPARLDGRPDVPPGSEPRVQPRQVLPGFTEALGIPLIEGRTIAETDTRDSLAVAVVNRAMARRYWGDRSPIGASITVLDGPRATQRRIVGVVGDVRSDQWPPTPAPTVYMPYAQNAFSTSMLFVVRSRAAPSALLPEIEKAVRRLDRGMPVYQVQTMRTALSVLDGPRLLLTGLLAAFGLLGLGLAASGLYAVVSYLVARRTREIGIRLALGAQPRDVLRLVVVDGMRQAGAGIAVGLLAAAGLTRFLEGQLYEVKATDAATYVGVSILLAAVAAAASAVPGWRASHTDPVRALTLE